ncbi:Nnf1-domain-containing protein [Lipomyces orientalis]|uniref:Nnf1-domain-containing protein n=1 Tax=Lipomyces orientalis TaxID=1233043 RepID=A0ACC3TL16_9ASCO
MVDSQPAPDPQQQPTSIRNERLLEIFQRSLYASTKTLTFSKLSQCYPYVAEHGAAGLREAMNQAMRFWESSSTREFHAILEERDVARKLTEFEALIEEARERKVKSEKEEIEGSEKKVFVENLTPEDLVRAHLTPINLAEAERLETRIQEAQASNKKLLHEVTAQEREIDDLFCSIKKSLDDLASASKESETLPAKRDMFASIDEINGLVRM